MKKTSSLLALGLLSSFLLGCTHVSQGISRDGKQADQIIFPELNKAWRDDGAKGTFPDIADLRKVAPGVTKTQLYQMFGAPQFSEGIFGGVHEWDYVFQLQGVKDTHPTLCQYKVLFDEHNQGQSFYWKPETCGKLVNETPTSVLQQKYTLNSELLFAHNSSVLLPAGQKFIQELARNIQNTHGTTNGILVTGYTDRLGSDSHNQMLSQARAVSVLNALMGAGFNVNKLRAVGAGESNPQSQGCVGERYTPELSACLQPDRRVEISVMSK